MARMRHLRYFKSQEEYNQAFENGELSWPRVCIWEDENENKNFEFHPLKETLIQIDDNTLLGCSDDIFLAI